MNIPQDWNFESSAVAKSFDAHVREQLPWYDLVTGAVAHIARHYIPRNGLVYDIGASTGNMGRALEATLKDRRAHLIALESSEAMCAQYQGPGELVQINALNYRFGPYDLAICFLVLMFLPVEKRLAFIENLKSQIKPGGALLIVDKTLAAQGYESTVLWRLALAGKMATGTKPSHVIAKELSLSGIQRPVDPKLLGEEAVEWFRFGEFAGWLIAR